MKGRRRQITVISFAYGTEENHNTLSKARSKTVEIQTTHFLNINRLPQYFKTLHTVRRVLHDLIVFQMSCTALHCLHSLTHILQELYQ